jgi:hypothetical protein
MIWVVVAFAVLALAASGGLLWWRQRVGGEIALMAATATSKATDVAAIAAGTMVEVKGTLRCGSALLAEFSKQSCVYYKSEIQRETAYYTRDSQGRRERKTRTETVHSSTRFAPCLVEDASGKVAVNLEGADVEGQQAVNRREAEERSLAGTVVSLALGGDDSSTLIYTETVLTADLAIYVLGEVQADHSVGKPAAGSKNRVFVVSTKSEAERTKDLRSTTLWLLVGAVVLAAVAVGLAILAINLKT